jgi:serine/threonine protein phosphatase 1
MQDKIYIIGDVHGCIKTLKALVSQLPKDAKIVLVGDLVDRGTNSKEVIEFVRRNNYDCVIGNHELLMIKNTKILQEDKRYNINSWFNNAGGYETLKSYNKDIFNIFLIENINWLNTLPYYLEYPNIKDENNRHLVVSHSSVGKYWKYKDYEYDSYDFKSFLKHISWNRDSSIDDNTDIFNIFGHTPVSNVVVAEYYANIDTGCAYTDGDLLGNLTAIEFPSKKIFIQKNID